MVCSSSKSIGRFNKYYKEIQYLSKDFLRTFIVSAKNRGGEFMKKFFIPILILVAWATLLPAQVTQEEANAIVQNYIESEAIQPAGAFYADATGGGISITTSNGEKINAKYACWAYYLNENEPAQRRYLFIKEDGGSLLEVIASNDVSELNDSWAVMDMPTGLAADEGNVKQLYPNPVGDILTLPCGENIRVEIYDLKGTRLFSGLLSGKDICQLNVSFLNTGVYMVNVSGEMYKMIKK